MAISVDTVYQTVLALANKEQRGYITPQEFNLFAKQAQMEIFEQYFYDVNQFGRLPQGAEEAFDPRQMVIDKLSIFSKQQSLVDQNPQNKSSHDSPLPVDWYRTKSVVANMPGNNRVIQKVSVEEYRNSSQGGYLTKPNALRAIYYNDFSNNRIVVVPNLADFSSYYGSSSTYSNVIMEYYRKPLDPKWTYVVVNDKAIWNPSQGAGGQDFQLHASEERDLILKILQLAGITIKDFALVQAAGQEVANVVQQEKQ